MWEFSKEVNEYLDKELVTPDNETEFLCAFKNAFYEQVSLDESQLDGCYYADVVYVWNQRIFIEYRVEQDDEDLIFDDLAVCF